MNFEVNKKKSSRRLMKVILIIVCFGIIVMMNPHSAFTPARSFVFRITKPIQLFFYSGAQSIVSAKDFLSSIGLLKNENQKLLEENQKLLAENVNLQDVRAENDMLRKQLDLMPKKDLILKSAWIIGQDSQGRGSWFLINQGERDGLREGMPVVVSQGILIGKISEVYSTTAKVILITSPESVINAVIERNEVKGIIRGEFGLSLVLDLVLQTDSLNVGDKVITSGIGEEFPRGLLIGVIQNIKESSDYLFQQASVLSFVQFNKLRLVFVVIDF